MNSHSVAPFRRRVILPVFVALVFAALVRLEVALPVVDAQGGTLDVDTIEDNGALQDCAPFVDNDCSLRGALARANSTSEPDTIVLGPGIFRLPLGRLEVTTDVTIRGAGAGASFIGQHPSEPQTYRGGFHVRARVDLASTKNRPDVLIRDVTISGGFGGFRSGLPRCGGGGGAILVEAEALVVLRDAVIARNYSLNTCGGGIANRGSMRIFSTTIEDNTADLSDTDGLGGGIFNAGDMLIDRSTIRGNHGFNGGGIFNAGRLTITNSTIGSNVLFPCSALNPYCGRGGGLMHEGKTLRLTNVTVSQNIAFAAGGGVYSDSPLSSRITYSTIIGNQVDSTRPDSSGAGVYRHSTDAAFVLQGTIVALNNGGGDCGGTPITTLGHNLDGDGTCALNGFMDLPAQEAAGIGIDEVLSPNLGPTWTHRLLAGSPAIDRIVPAAGNCPHIDQRGAPRPEVSGGKCDIGAFERQPFDP